MYHRAATRFNGAAAPRGGYPCRVLLHAPASLGDVLDRLTILDLKVARLADGAARANAAREHALLLGTWRDAGLPDPAAVPEAAELAAVNGTLWEVEDRLRAREAAGDFGPEFVADARAVYRTNDRRAALKRAVNLRFGSALIEEKQHPRYGTAP